MDSPVVDPVNELITPLEHDTPCIHCGYNLRGLETTGRCPECGSVIVDSTRGDLLRYADPKWLERIRFGTSLKLWNIAIGILLGIAAGIFVGMGVPEVALLVVALVGAVLGLLATFAITSQEPKIALREDPITLRNVVRACVVGNSLGALLQWNMFVGSAVMVIIVVAASAVFQLLGIAVAFGELIYFRRFALRIPDAKLAKSTKSLMWVVPFAFVCSVGSVVFFVASARQTASTSVPLEAVGLTLLSLVAGVFACVSFAVLAYCVLRYVRLLTKYNKAFKEAVMLAKAGAVG